MSSSSKETPISECEFRTPFGTLHAKRWGTEGGRPVLALHGWLDNCASFDFLAPKLEDVDLIALDLAGHARSDFRKSAGPYNIWQDLHEIHFLVNSLGWEQFSMLGHSRGAMISTLYAGTFPKAVTRLACLDALCPLPVEENGVAAQLAFAIESTFKGAQEKKNTYKTFEDAVNARCNGLFELSREDSTVLADRGVVQLNNQFSWRYDPQLLLPSDVKFSKGQLEDFLVRIKAPLLLITAQNGIVNAHKKLLDDFLKIKPMRHEQVDGGHHFHMSEHFQAVALMLNEFLKSEDSE